MGGMENPAPEYPDSLPPDIEEWNLGQPELFVGVGEWAQAGSSQRQHPLDICLNRRRLTWWEQRLHRRLGPANKLGKESPLREDLVSQDLADRAASGMEPELELI